VNISKLSKYYKIFIKTQNMWKVRRDFKHF